MTAGPKLRPTFDAVYGSRYRRRGGPWDRGALDESLAASGGCPVVDDHGRFSARGLEAAIRAVAGGLSSRGVRRHEVVAWQLANGAASLALYRACWRIGAVAAPLHHKLGRAEIEGALAQVEPALVVSGAQMPAVEHPEASVLAAPGDVGQLVELLGDGSGPGVGEVSVHPADIAVVLFTSGSSGIPKAVLHSHRALGYKAQTMVEVHGLTGSDVVLMPAPLAHVSGLLNGVLLPAMAGIRSVLMDRWDPAEALGIVREEGVSFMGAPPVFFSQMAESEGYSKAAVSSLRLVSTGGASVSPALVDSISASFDCRVKRTYGSTEAPTVATSGPSDSEARARETDGHAVGEVELQIHDPLTGVRLGAGEPGEIWIRGPELFVGYAQREATLAARARGGWYRSADLGTLDEAGWLRVVGRLSDVIIRAGENISASEVEAALEAHPSVRHAVVVAVPDAGLGERVAAYIEATGPFDLQRCRDWFAERGVTRFKTPEIVVVLDEIPVLATGKPDRNALRKAAAEHGDDIGRPDVLRRSGGRSR